MIARTTLCSLLSVCLSTGALVLPSTAAASSIPAMTLVARAQMGAPASVLGLDSEDAAAGKALTQALRRAFAARGMSGGEEMSFSEVKLTMGCENDDPKCLAQAGETLGVNRLIYGYLKKSGGGNFKVEVFVLDVGQGVIEAETTVPVSAADLSQDRIDDTATEIVNSLYPDEEDGELPATPLGGETKTGNGDEPVIRDKPKRESDYVWGPYKPRPTWKWAGFGVGVGLAALGIVFAGVGYSKIRPGGSLEKELFKQADESLSDMKDGNDIDRAQGGDLCARAMAAPPGEPDAVTNHDVSKVCQQADGWTLATNISWGVLVVGAIMTVTFTTLLFVHKAKPKANAFRRDRRLHFDASPTRGGAMFTSGGRF